MLLQVHDELVFEAPLVADVETGITEGREVIGDFSRFLRAAQFRGRAARRFSARQAA